jgi:hypothetical protein
VPGPRDITTDEAREFTHIVRRIAALILWEQRLDANYAAVTEQIYAWPHAEPAVTPTPPQEIPVPGE